MDNFDLLYTEVLGLLDRLKQSFDVLTNEKKVIDLRYQDVKTSYEIEFSAHKQCQDRLEAVIKENEKMKDQIRMLEEDRAQFAKVSHIIALEKDNAKLKAELEAHKSRLAEAEKKKVVLAQIQPEETVTQQPTAAEPEDSEFYEKKIGGVRYYIGVETKTIYQIVVVEDDEAVGDPVGKLEKDPDTGKTKVSWF
jgi:hypothetical protein